MSDMLEKLAPDTPIITIERDNEPHVAPPDGKLASMGQERQEITIIGSRRPWLKWLFIAAITSTIILTSLIALRYWAYYYHIGVPVSVTPAENIEKLKAPLSQQTPEVFLTSDSVLGVALDFYALKGLQASIEFSVPDTTDTSVYLYTRCADYAKNGKYLGSLVANGQDLQSDKTRLGYMAMANGNMVIGVNRSDKVKDYVKSQNGSFFRQFILVSDGVLPPRFHLHGKVERCAIGRIGDMLYYITTKRKETLWDFADALREYGFIDAIYITGGNSHSFYRDRNLMTHDIGTTTDSVPTDTTQSIIPWLVFRPAK